MPCPCQFIFTQLIQPTISFSLSRSPHGTLPYSSLSSISSPSHSPSPSFSLLIVFSSRVFPSPLLSLHLLFLLPLSPHTRCFHPPPYRSPPPSLSSENTFVSHFDFTSPHRKETNKQRTLPCTPVASISHSTFFICICSFGHWLITETLAQCKLVDIVELVKSLLC